MLFEPEAEHKQSSKGGGFDRTEVETRASEIRPFMAQKQASMHPKMAGPRWTVSNSTEIRGRGYEEINRT